nr:MAG TPA: mindbomb E3 ubiquitin protein ligase [Caudoviricetes sp.]
MSINRFKVGDKVRVRKDLKVDCAYGGYLFISSMERLVDKVNTITGIHNDADAYLLNQRDEGWTDEMLEPAEKTLYNLEKGDVVLLNNGISRKVLAAIDNCYLLSHSIDFTSAGVWYTVDDLKHYECTVQQPEVETIEINDKKYNKAEVEEAIKDLKVVD